MFRHAETGLFSKGERLFYLWPTVGLVLLVLLTSSVASARTWYIKADGSGDAPTIQAGVDSAAAGDTVLVGPGVYADTHEIMVDGVSRIVNVHLYKDIRLIAEQSTPKPMINGVLSNIGVYVDRTGNESELRGFSVSTVFMPFGCMDGVANAAPQPDFQIAVRCDRSSIEITENDLVDNGIAIRLRHSPAYISGNVISSSYFGIACEDASDASIIGNTISGCADLIQCFSSAPEIRQNDLSAGCTAVNCGINSPALITHKNIHNIEVWGVAVLNSAAVVEDNSFRGGDVGFTAQGDCDGLLVSRNLFYSHLTCAVDLVGVRGAIVEYNTIDLIIEAGRWALRLQGSHPTIKNNIVTRSPFGMVCLMGSSPSFECNDIYAVNVPYAGDCSDQTGLNGNIAADPEFCGIDDSGNYYLQSDSPCAPGNHPAGYDCGVIGALPVNCGTVEAARQSWGSIKSLYKRDH